MQTARNRPVVVISLLAVALSCCGVPDETESIVVETMPGMVSLEAGVFSQGCNNNIDGDCDVDEFPRRFVSLDAFFFDETEVTQAAYNVCVERGDCEPTFTDNPICGWDPVTKADHPAVCVTHTQATLYCAAQGKRLPTEAEWERAARGSTSAIFPWGNESIDCTRANVALCGGDIAPVRSFPEGATKAGVFEMAGNVGEWVSDWYSETYYANQVDENPTGPESGAYRVIRGGSFAADGRYARASNRGADQEGAFRFTVGFRCAVSQR